jgi:mono/diheme cytochrome c family protein
MKAAYTSTFIMLLFISTISCSTRRSLPIEGPLTLNEQEQKGKKVFMTHCQRCHPQGEAGLGPAINWAPSFGKRFQIRHGLGAMPAFDKQHISDEELDDVLSYLKALKKNS